MRLSTPNKYSEHQIEQDHIDIRPITLELNQQLCDACELKRNPAKICIELYSRVWKHITLR